MLETIFRDAKDFVLLFFHHEDVVDASVGAGEDVVDVSVGAGEDVVDVAVGCGGCVSGRR